MGYAFSLLRRRAEEDESKPRAEKQSVLIQIYQECLAHKQKFGREPTHVSLGRKQIVDLSLETMEFYHDSVMGYRLIKNWDDEIRVGRM